MGENESGLEALGLTKNMTITNRLRTQAMELRDGGEISDLQQKILDHCAMFPDLTGPEAGDDLGTSRQWVNTTKRQYGHIYDLNDS